MKEDVKMVINQLLKNKLTLILIFTVFVLVVGGFLVTQKFFVSKGAVLEIDLTFDAEGPYALLSPRRDGNALILNLKRTSSYDAISYELAYTSLVDETVVKAGQTTDTGDETSGAIDRGVAGVVDTKAKKSEYTQEILFGTCSKNVCKYDKGVENGTLTLHIKKANKAYRMITQWHLQKPDVALGILTSGDAHLVYKVSAERLVLANIDYSIINDLTGVPKLPVGKEVLGKVYALNVPTAKTVPAGNVSLELVEAPPADSKLERWDEGENKWVEMETKIDGSKLSAKADSGGIFAVLIPKK